MFLCNQALAGELDQHAWQQPVTDDGNPRILISDFEPEEQIWNRMPRFYRPTADGDKPTIPFSGGKGKFMFQAGTYIMRSNYNNAGAHLAGIRQLPEVHLDVQVYCKDILLDGQYAEARMLLHVENNTEELAFFTEFKLEGLGDDAILIFDDNYTHILPNTEKDIWVRIINLGSFTGMKTANMSVGGWNAKKKSIQEFTLTFK